MKTNFKEYLEKKKAQKIIDKFAKQYKDKKIILYGTGLFAGDLIRNYDLSALNIIGAADIKFKDSAEGDFYGFKKLSPYDLIKTDFDILLITTYDDTYIKESFKNVLFKGKNIKFAIKTLIRLNLFEYIKALIKEDL